MSRWRLARAYQDGRRRATALVSELDPMRVAVRVPACPERTVRDLVAHVLGVAADTIAGEFFVRAGDGWRDPEGAATPVAARRPSAGSV